MLRRRVTEIKSVLETIGTYINAKILALSNATYSLSLLIVCQIIVVVASSGAIYGYYGAIW